MSFGGQPGEVENEARALNSVPTLQMLEVGTPTSDDSVGTSELSINKEQMAYVYILQSLKNGRYYIGSTIDINQRFLWHSKGRVISTKKLLPVKLILQQEYPTISIARSIENKLKKFKRRDFINKIIREGKIKIRGA